nr:hypothetical protein [Chlamydiifrater volucris]
MMLAVDRNVKIKLIELFGNKVAHIMRLTPNRLNEEQWPLASSEQMARVVPIHALRVEGE